MKKIIIAEDEAITALNFKTNAQNLGFEVMAVVRSGKDAVEKALALNPDMAFLDISMEHRSAGIEAAKMIQEQNSRIKIYFVSAYKKSMYEDEIEDIEYEDFIDKFEFPSRLESILKNGKSALPSE